MASSMMSSAATVSHAATGQITMMSSFSGLKSSSSFPATSKPINGVASTGVKVRCMQVRPPAGMKKFETLSYLPPLSQVSLAKEVDYLLRKGWIPCLEFELEVLKELEEAKKAYPKAFIRIIGFDNIRQVQCMSFITYKP